MIQLIVGVPGSGKSYLAVYKMSQEKKPIWTNIPLNSDLSGKVVKNFESWDEVLDIVKQLYPLRDKRDDCIQLANDLNFYGLALYYDECHMGLDRQNKELVWFFTWHRHLEFDIYLITQNKNAIVAKYRTLPEVFTLAVPASRRLRLSVFKYKDYAGFAMAKDQIRSFSIKSDPEIFKLYQTGEFNKGTAEIRKKGLLIGLFFLFIPFVFYFVYDFIIPDPVPAVVSSNDKNITKKNNIQNINDINKTKTLDYDPYPVIVEKLGNYFKYNGYFLDINNSNEFTKKSINKIFRYKNIQKKIASSYSIIKFEKSAKKDLDIISRGWR